MEGEIFFFYVEAKIIYHQETNLSEMLKEIFQKKENYIRQKLNLHKRVKSLRVVAIACVNIQDFFLINPSYETMAVQKDNKNAT